MREEFEKLPIVAKYLPYVFFNKETQGYCSKSDNMVPLDFALFLNGAWYAFQEQQNKLNGVLDLACKLQYSNGERIYNEIKELLK